VTKDRLVGLDHLARRELGADRLLAARRQVDHQLLAALDEPRRDADVLGL
jgi:hypothetical protein